MFNVQVLHYPPDCSIKIPRQKQRLLLFPSWEATIYIIDEAKNHLEARTYYQHGPAGRSGIPSRLTIEKGRLPNQRLYKDEVAKLKSKHPEGRQAG